MDPMLVHPDDLELELVRTGEAGAETCAHVLQCIECTDRLESEQKFAGALKDAFGARIEVPEMVDARVLKAGQRASFRVRRGRWRWVAAAAIFLIATSVPWMLRDSAVAPADINEDGVVDIIDAFVLARRIEAGRSLDSTWDFDGSGQVNRSDAEFIALSLVQQSVEVVR